jgi:hypothetical protein
LIDLMKQPNENPHTMVKDEQWYKKTCYNIQKGVILCV